MEVRRGPAAFRLYSRHLTLRWRIIFSLLVLLFNAFLCCSRCSAAWRRAEGGAGREGPALPQPAQHEALAQPEPVHSDAGQREGGARLPGTQGEHRPVGEFEAQPTGRRPVTSALRFWPHLCFP